MMNPQQTLTIRAGSHHRYACARCRLRKVKCDKVLPACVYCLEAGVQCAYLARRPRNSSKLQQIPIARRPLLPAEEGTNTTIVSKLLHELQDDVQSDGDDDEDLIVPREIRNSTYEARSDYRQSDKGRLFVDQGKSRYINADKAEQVANLESILKTNVEEASTPDLLGPQVNYGGSSLLHTPSMTTSLRNYHPSTEQMNVLWEYYVQNVDILVKIIYKPSAEILVIKASTDFEGLSPSAEAFLFAIWFAAITAMSSEECLRLLKAERTTLLVRYRNVLEQALAQAGWMISQEVLVLQALALYIRFIPWKDSRSRWMLSGIALSIAQAMGMHSDSDSFCLGTIETELRRRIWWSLCQLDVHLSDDCGLEPHAPLAMDTRLPLHINDSDLLHETENTVPRTELTEMTLSLVKIEMAETRLKVKRLQYGSSSMSISTIESMVQEKIQRYEETYLSYLNGASYLGHLCHLGVRIIIAKLWKMKYDLSQEKRCLEDTQPQTNEGLMLYNADILEIAHQFPGRSDQLGWFFRCKHTQWHAMAYLLIELYKAPQNPAADKAWAVLDAIFSNAKDERTDDTAQLASMRNHTTSSVLWLPMLRLYNRACQTRKHAAQTSPDSGYETTAATPIEEHTRPVIHEEGLLGDPFFGSGMEFGEDMSWEQLDTWFQSFQSDPLGSEENIGTRTNDRTGVFYW